MSRRVGVGEVVSGAEAGGGGAGGGRRSRRSRTEGVGGVLAAVAAGSKVGVAVTAAT